MSEWIYNREADGAFTETWSAARKYRVSAWVKTEKASGRGASLALRWACYNYPERFPYVSSERVTGTSADGQWSQLTVEVSGPPPELRGSGTALQIILRQDGRGIAWFDDIDVQVLSTVAAAAPATTGDEKGGGSRSRWWCHRRWPR